MRYTLVLPSVPNLGVAMRKSLFRNLLLAAMSAGVKDW
jgi:hypothetical protein